MHRALTERCGEHAHTLLLLLLLLLVMLLP